MRYHEIASINGQLSPARATGFLWIREPYVIAFEGEGCRITWIFDDSAARMSTKNLGSFLRVIHVPLYNIYVIKRAARNGTHKCGTSYETALSFRFTMLGEEIRAEFYWKVSLFAANHILLAMRREFSYMKIEFPVWFARPRTRWQWLAFDKWQDECHPDRIAHSAEAYLRMDARENYREGISQIYRRTQVAIRIRAPRRTFIHNVPRDETLKSHFNEKGKSRITALPLPDDGAVPAGTVDR